MVGQAHCPSEPPWDCGNLSFPILPLPSQSLEHALERTEGDVRALSDQLSALAVSVGEQPRALEEVRGAVQQVAGEVESATRSISGRSTKCVVWLG